MEVVLEVWGLNTQSRLASKHRQAASLGVGGSVGEATKDEFCAGQPGYVAAGALLCGGTLTNVTAPYAACKLAKSVDVVTVDPSAEILTMPNWPASLCAGKYEKATPPDQTGAARVPNSAATSAQGRGYGLLHPYSLKYATTLKPEKSPVTGA
jgi:hypothetical protein